MNELKESSRIQVENFLREQQENSLRSEVRRGEKVPIDLTELECKIEHAIRKGGAKLSELFLIVHGKDEGYFNLELPEKVLEDLKKNLKIDIELASLDSRRGVDLSKHVDSKKLKVFYLFYCPQNLLLWNKKFNYPQVSKVSKRPFEIIGGKESNIQ